MAFTHTLRVRYGEVDPQGIVFNAHWLAYFDEAATRFVEALGYPPKETFLIDKTFDFALVKASIEWQGGAGFDDLVEVEVAPVRLGNSSYDLRHVARVDGREVCRATITYVSVDPAEMRSRPIPDDVRAKLTEHLIEA